MCALGLARAGELSGQRVQRANAGDLVGRRGDRLFEGEDGVHAAIGESRQSLPETSEKDGEAAM